MKSGLRGASRPGSICHARHLVLLAAAIAWVGCVTPTVETKVGAGIDLSAYPTVFILPIAYEEGLLSPDSELPSHLGELARKRISGRGYGLVEDPPAALAIQVTLAVETVQRQTWDSDPDASRLVVREFEEAVLQLRAFDQDRDEEVWQAESRSRLPEEDLLVGPSRASVWRSALREAIDRFPEASPST